MAQPKRRWSKARTHSKRSTWKKEQMSNLFFSKESDNGKNFLWQHYQSNKEASF